MNGNGDEKRRAIRISKSLVSRYSYGSNKDWDQTIIKNISETGALFTTRRPFCESETVTLLIKFPFSPYEWVEFRGNVVACEGLETKFGTPIKGTHLTRIEFAGLNAVQKELIRKYIAWFISKGLRRKL